MYLQLWGFSGDLVVKEPACQCRRRRCGLKEMATHSNILAWKTLQTEELGGLRSTGSQRVGHDWACTLIYNYSIMPNSFIALKILLSLATSQPLANTNLFTLSVVLPFPECWHHAVCSLLRLAFFHLAICMWVSSMSFHGLIAHFILLLNNIPYSG